MVTQVPSVEIQIMKKHMVKQMRNFSPHVLPHMMAVCASCVARGERHLR